MSVLSVSFLECDGMMDGLGVVASHTGASGLLGETQTIVTGDGSAECEFNAGSTVVRSADAGVGEGEEAGEEVVLAVGEGIRGEEGD